MKGYEGMTTDDIVDKLKKVGWEDIYDGHNMRVQQTHNVQIDDDTFLMYYIKWATKHVESTYNVLDVGCGFGKLIYLMKEKGAKCTGVDVSSKTIESVKDIVKDVEFKQMYAEDLKFPDESFDCVTATELLEHVVKPKVIINEMLRVLKPGGKLIITIPIREHFALDGKSKHINKWGYYEIMHLFEEFGENFKVYWLNKFVQLNHGEDKWSEPKKKNIFGIVFIKDEVKEDGR